MVFLLKDARGRERKPFMLKDSTISSFHTLKVIGKISSNCFSMKALLEQIFIKTGYCHCANKTDKLLSWIPVCANMLFSGEIIKGIQKAKRERDIV